MRKEVVIFDLDGTVLDTLEDLKNSVNHALVQSGFPVRTLEQVRGDVGNGIRKLILRSLPADVPGDVFDRVFTDFRQYYAKHCADTTRPYPGIPELLHALRRNGMRTAVVSNKADNAVQLLIERFFPCQFDAVLGEREGLPQKPAPEPVFTVLSELNVEPHDAIYVGDSDVDVKTANNAGVPCISVDWGFRSTDVLAEAGAEHIVSSPDALLEALMSF